MSKVGYYEHWVPSAKIKEGFPFSYELGFTDEEPRSYTTIEITDGDNLKEIIREDLIKTFPFFALLDETKYQESELKKYIKSYKVIAKQAEQVPKIGKDGKKLKGTRTVYTIVDEKYITASNFTSDYRYTMIQDTNHLKQVMDGVKVISFDTETTGLNPLEDYIVGISFSTKPKHGYYIPIKHSDNYSHLNLGNEGLVEFCNIMKTMDTVFVFNLRFDVRMMEFTKGLELDLSNVSFIDTQLNAYFADPGYPIRNLKQLEQHFLGYIRPDLATTLRSRGIKSFDTSLIDPKNLLFYAGQDAISTLELGINTMKYYEEFGISGQLDQMIPYRLMKMENNPIRIDLEYLEEQLSILEPKLAKLDDTIKAEIGDVNLNSPKQKIELFKSFGLDTGKKTKTGAMATGKEAVEEMIGRLEKENKKYPKWLGLLNERAKLDKLLGGFFRTLYEQAKENGGYVRINYRHGVTTTGRFSSGEERIF